MSGRYQSVFFGWLSVVVALSQTHCGGTKKRNAVLPSGASSLNVEGQGTGEGAGPQGGGEVGLSTELDYGSLSQNDLMKLSLAELESIFDERSHQNASELAEWERLKAVNTALCQRLSSLRSGCLVAARLLPDGNERQLQCSGDYAQGQALHHTFEVELAGNKPGQYYFLVNDTYQSTVFGAGKTRIWFKAIGNAASLAPQLKQIYKMHIRVAHAGTSIPEPKDFMMQFLVDGVPVLRNPVLPSDDIALKDTMLRVNLSEMQMISKSSQCVVTDDEVQSIKSKSISLWNARSKTNPEKGYHQP